MSVSPCTLAGHRRSLSPPCPTTPGQGRLPLLDSVRLSTCSQADLDDLVGQLGACRIGSSREHKELKLRKIAKSPGEYGLRTLEWLKAAALTLDVHVAGTTKAAYVQALSQHDYLTQLRHRGPRLSSAPAPSPAPYARPSSPQRAASHPLHEYRTAPPPPAPPVAIPFEPPTASLDTRRPAARYDPLQQDATACQSLLLLKNLQREIERLHAYVQANPRSTCLLVTEGLDNLCLQLRNSPGRWLCERASPSQPPQRGDDLDDDNHPFSSTARPPHLVRGPVSSTRHIHNDTGPSQQPPAPIPQHSVPYFDPVSIVAATVPSRHADLATLPAVLGPTTLVEMVAPMTTPSVPATSYGTPWPVYRRPTRTRGTATPAPRHTSLSPSHPSYLPL
ncbi:hypothetical protein A1O7_06965 [Cladophialophora yegresii CBS 114405]|uniref:Uncharacterized protein n=1 Tax=Cladophialophora yegresii CBS 114405 TaxID=1182544 RepID=W9VWL8_9EURO|nr:uncharacterized protein A1O7_06965 [Cladophialophora yegresii CBS 114405]EXJ56621.1 hypothetical protein A1O7_06965 [Cladophialophora yegresii CBS 114405]